MKVAVTGAGGFLGRALIDGLIKSGDKPLAIVKKAADCDEFEKEGIEAACRDLSRVEDCVSLLRGYDAIVHCAALTRDFGRWDDFNRYNIITTENILREAAKAEVGKFIHISTTAVYGNERNHYGTDEDADFGQRIVDPYTRSKIIADQRVLDFMRTSEMPIVLLRFGNIWGPDDPNILTFIVENLKKKRMVIEGGGDNVLSLTFIENATDAILLALKNNSANGRIFNITDGIKVTSKKLISDIIGILGIKYKLRNVPYPLIYSMAYFFEQYFLFTGRRTKPPLTRFAARFLKYSAIFDISRAMNELGYHPRVSYKEAIAKTSPYIKALYFGNSQIK